MASTSSKTIVQIPFRDRLVTAQGLLSQTWTAFFRLLQEILAPLGSENTAELNNDQVTKTDIAGMAVSSSKVSQAIVEYFIQRVTENTNAVELVETGYFYLVYRPKQKIWVKVPGGTSGPDSAGVTITVTSLGQCQYTSTLVDGSASISKINFRIRTLSGKNKPYSSFG